MKLKVQAQHLQLGDIVGSGEIIDRVTLNSIVWPSNKCMVTLHTKDEAESRSVLWGKYTMINVERKE